MKTRGSWKSELHARRTKSGSRYRTAFLEDTKIWPVSLVKAEEAVLRVLRHLLAAAAETLWKT